MSVKNRDHSPDDPSNTLLGKALESIKSLIREAEHRGVSEPTSVSLATTGKNARPSVRTVYLSAVLDEGLLFFANMESGKGKQMLENPHVALCFFWADMQQQVIVEGDIKVVDDSESDRFWMQRSRESRLAAWASDQSSEVEDRATLKAQRDEAKAQYNFSPVPRPEQWRAIMVHPNHIEFWETGWHRLRPRYRYQKGANGAWHENAESP